MFKSIIRRKRIIDQELELYRREKHLEIEEEMQDSRRELDCIKVNVCHEKEKKGIEIARLSAEISALNDKNSGFNAKLRAKEEEYESLNNECHRLYKLIDALIGKLPDKADVNVIAVDHGRSK